jgi:hypothetical protein
VTTLKGSSRGGTFSIGGGGRLETALLYTITFRSTTTTTITITTTTTTIAAWAKGRK